MGESEDIILRTVIFTPQADTDRVERCFNIVCCGATVDQPNPRHPRPFLLLSAWLKLLRGSGLLSNTMTLRTASRIFHKTVGLSEGDPSAAHRGNTSKSPGSEGWNRVKKMAGVESPGSSADAEPRHLIHIDDFVLLITSVAEHTYATDTEETSEWRLLKICKEHIFPAVLQPKNVVGEDEVLDMLLSPECLPVLNDAEDLLSPLFVHYAGGRSLKSSTSLSLENIEELFADCQVCPNLLPADAVVVAFTSTGTKRKRRLPHFIEIIGRTAISAFEHMPLVELMRDVLPQHRLRATLKYMAQSPSCTAACGNAKMIKRVQDKLGMDCPVHIPAIQREEREEREDTGEITKVALRVLSLTQAHHPNPNRLGGIGIVELPSEGSLEHYTCNVPRM